MRTKRLAEVPSLNDPERPIVHKAEGNDVEVHWIASNGQSCSMTFLDVERFTSYAYDPYAGIADGEAYEVLESRLVAEVKSLAYQSDAPDLRHYLLATNDGDWVEAICCGYRLPITYKAPSSQGQS